MQHLMVLFLTTFALSPAWAKLDSDPNKWPFEARQCLIKVNGEVKLKIIINYNNGDLRLFTFLGNPLRLNIEEAFTFIGNLVSRESFAKSLSESKIETKNVHGKILEVSGPACSFSFEPGDSSLNQKSQEVSRLVKTWIESELKRIGGNYFILDTKTEYSCEFRRGKEPTASNYLGRYYFDLSGRNAKLYFESRTERSNGEVSEFSFKSDPITVSCQRPNGTNIPVTLGSEGIRATMRDAWIRSSNEIIGVGNGCSAMFPGPQSPLHQAMTLHLASIVGGSSSNIAKLRNAIPCPDYSQSPDVQHIDLVGEYAPIIPSISSQ